MSRAFTLSALLALLASAPACSSDDSAQPAPATVAKGTFSGFATDTAGKPLPGVEVSTSPSAGYAVSDGSGAWKLESVAAGTYALTATRSGYATVEKPGVVVAAGGSAIVDFQLAPLAALGEVAGRVTDAKTKAPIALATVSTEAVTVQVETGADGSYRLTGVAVGAYKVRAAAKGYGTKLSDTVTVTAGASTTVDLALDRTLTFDSTCTSCHTRVEQLLADLTADPLPTVIGEGGSAGEG